MLTWLLSGLGTLKSFVPLDFLLLSVTYGLIVKIINGYGGKRAPVWAQYARWLFMVANVAYVAAPTIREMFSSNSEFDTFRGAYSLLEVSPSASAKQISRKYRSISASTHPDKSGGDHDLHILISTANGILKDDIKKFVHDRAGSHALRLSNSIDLATWVNNQLSRLLLSSLYQLFTMVPSILIMRPPKQLWLLNVAANILAASAEAVLLTGNAGYLLEVPIFQWVKMTRLALAVFFVVCRWTLSPPPDPIVVQSAKTELLAADYDVLLSSAALQASQPFKRDVDLDARAKEHIKAAVLNSYRLSDPAIARAYAEEFIAQAKAQAAQAVTQDTD